MALMVNQTAFPDCIDLERVQQRHRGELALLKSDYWIGNEGAG